jgi:hypothetical protein
VIFVSSKTNHNSLVMEQIPSLLKGISNLLPTTNIHQLVSIIIGIYTISSGGVTQRNISRYSDISYRGVARFMAIQIEWHKVLIQIYLTENGFGILLYIEEPKFGSNKLS